MKYSLEKTEALGMGCECVGQQKAVGTWELFQQVSGTKLEILLPRLSHESWYNYYLIPPKTVLSASGLIIDNPVEWERI